MHLPTASRSGSLSVWAFYTWVTESESEMLDASWGQVPLGKNTTAEPRI